MTCWRAGPVTASGTARASTPAIPTAPAARSPRQLPPGSPRVWRSRRRSGGRANTSIARSSAPPASAAATARSTTRTRCAKAAEMRLEFVTVDVFTERRFGGNPLAVIPHADGLTPAVMQAIAGEFNLSETTFVLRPQDPAHSAEVRIFTPKFEMPFAGHPNVGTAFVIGRQGPRRDRLVFEEQAGLVPIDLLDEGGAVVGARLTAPQPLQRGENDVSADIVAAACGLEIDDIETRRHVPCVAGCGTSFVFAEVKSREAIARAQPRTEMFARHFPVAG